VTVSAKVVVHSGYGTADLAPPFLAVQPSLLTLAPGQSGSVTVTLDAAAAATSVALGKDVQAYVLFYNESNELAHVPLWGRLVCSETERKDVLVIDADTSSCTGSSEAD
jgi:hypothetical protein